MVNTIRAWILLSTLLVASGWILSAVHQLNRVGYGIVFAVAAIAVVYWRRRTGWHPQKSPAQLWLQFRKRFKRPAPLMFLALAALSFTGGALYACTDLDADAYRIPRIFHWLGSGQWHWIHTTDFRMNIAGCGFEWLAAPLALFSGTDRLLFLLNVASYLMLPGLIFSFFTRLGVRGRVAWWWMWILSSGWCFVMQAGSVDNDSFAAVYALAAVDLALRAKEKGSISDLWLSLLAAALLTGVKQTNIPLVLLWFIAAWPAFRLWRRRPIATVAVAALALLVSVLPTTIFNWQHYGNWTGFPDDPHSLWAGTQLHSPFWGIVGNSFCLTVQNLLPPYFPGANAWNGAMLRFLRTPFGSHFAGFEHFGYLNHGISGANAGIGLGICFLVVVSVCAVRRFRQPPGGLSQSPHRWLLWTPFLLLLVFMAKVGAFQNARQLAPYYIFFFPLLLIPSGHIRLVRQLWWQRLGLLIMLLSVGTLMIERRSPLFPARTILEPLAARHPHSRVISQAWKSYSNRFRFEALRNHFQRDLTANDHVIGYATKDGSAEPGLWLPFGERRVVRVLPDDTPEQLRGRGVSAVVVEDFVLEEKHETIGQWVARYNAVLTDQFAFQYDPYRPTNYLYFVRLR